MVSIRKQLIKLRVNGELREVSVAPQETLLDVIREHLGLTGTKLGCGDGQCGTCTVLLDGKAVKSCLLPAVDANGKEILTIEGLAQGNDLHPLQQAFIEKGAIQCGFCTPGMIMTAEALLRRNPNPTNDDIQKALAKQLCRCGGYRKIAEAIQYGSQLKQGKVTKKREVTPSDTSLIGSRVPLVESRGKALGATKYIADLQMPGMLYAKAVRSPYHHALIRGIDTSAAEQMAGVAALISAHDMKGKPLRPDQPLIPYMPTDKVRYIGEAVAIIAAESKEIADDAVSKVKVDYEPIPHVLMVDDAVKEGAPQLHLKGNITFEEELTKGNVEEGFSQSDVIVENEYSTPSQEHAPMETEGALAYIDDDGILTVLSCTQVAYTARMGIADMLELEYDKVRVIATPIGGGFGGKSSELFHILAAALLCHKAKQPVKYIFTREESLVSSRKRHAAHMKLKTGASRDGKLMAMEALVLANSGAYSEAPRSVIPRHMTEGISGPYETPHIHTMCKEVCTNAPKAAFMRGLGAIQPACACEQQIDILAAKLKMDPWEFRYRNALRIGSVYAAGNVIQEPVEELGKYLDAIKPHYDQLIAISHGQGTDGIWKRGIGLACGMHGHSIRLPAKASVELLPSGQIEVRAGIGEMGTGNVTALAMIVAEELKVPLDAVRVITADTKEVPYPFMTVSEASVYVLGKAALDAAKQLRECLIKAAAKNLGGANSNITLEGGWSFLSDNPAKRMSLGDLAAYCHDTGIQLRYEGENSYANYQGFVQVGPNTGQPVATMLLSYAVTLAEVYVNIKTGEVKVAKVFVVTNPGRVINQLAFEQQVEGAVVFGLGFTLKEDFVPGKIRSLKDYRIPTIADAPEVVPILVEIPVASGPFGAKGIGETASVGTPPAVLNAIADASGARLFKLPATPKRILAALSSSTK